MDNGTNRISPYTFTASTNQITFLAEIFACVTPVSSQGLMIIRPEQIIIYSEYNHICSVHLSLDEALFTTYNFYSEKELSNEIAELKFGIDIGLISEAFSAVCASMLTKAKLKSSNSKSLDPNNDTLTCYITYNGEGNPLIVEFEDNLMSEKIEFYTFCTDLQYPYDLDDPDNSNVAGSGLLLNHSELQFQTIMKSDVFAILLKDLQHIGTEEIYIQTSNRWKKLGSKEAGKDSINSQTQAYSERQLAFISKGTIGYLKLLFPREKTILEQLDVYANTEKGLVPINSSKTARFDYSIFSKIFRSVKISHKCKLMKDSSGVMSVQIMCKNSPDHSGTIISFHLLETCSDDNYDVNEHEGHQIFDFTNVFEDETYEYIKDYGKRQRKEKVDSREIDISQYEDLDCVPASPKGLSYDIFRKQNKANNNNVRNQYSDASSSHNGENSDIPLFL